MPKERERVKKKKKKIQENKRKEPSVLKCLKKTAKGTRNRMVSSYLQPPLMMNSDINTEDRKVFPN